MVFLNAVTSAGVLIVFHTLHGAYMTKMAFHYSGFTSFIYCYYLLFTVPE